MSDTLRSRMIRAAYDNPELRTALLPLINRSTSDLRWATAEIEKCVDQLEDVVDVLTARGPGAEFEANTSLADDHREVAEAVELLRKLSTVPAKLRRIR